MVVQCRDVVLDGTQQHVLTIGRRGYLAGAGVKTNALARGQVYS